MKKIGLIGGMSWESTSTYYQLINQGIKQALGGLNSARIVLDSVNFCEIEQDQRNGEWDRAADKLITSARALESAGADFFLICTNTMHIVAETVAAEVTIPLLHIADATANKLVHDGKQTVGLLGTAFTMEQPFYTQRLSEKYNLEVLTPEAVERKKVHAIIYHELCLGKIVPESKQIYLNIIDQLVEKGAQAIILGCTEIAMLIKQSDTGVPLYDTTRLHADAAVIRAINQE
ncbi:aspartate/glutamate racemase family protein [Alteromonas sediminis]|uniref:Aspartate/glutamate racemase family protein n=1 Tax=Alteromonas sediminis TaxID=2259342 RepID=A0A3N5Y397_9ALTE|nr:aspartate/glutamate racemase family protein [Alteromonas sediminis]RPJ67603.1 aspartate/glutamate racemase family protein [Alteromonas sediminis]